MDAERLRTISRAFDARSATYDDSRMHRELAAAVADFADLTAVVDVLDIATGTGLVLRMLAERSPALALTGIDLSPGMLEVARTQLPSAEFIEADAAELPLGDASADLITCITGLHVIPDTSAALSEWRRLLRSHGRIVTATFLADGRGRPLRKSHPYPADHLPFESLELLTATAATHGLAIIRSVVWSDEVDRLLIAEWARG